MARRGRGVGRVGIRVPRRGSARGVLSRVTAVVSERFSVPAGRPVVISRAPTNIAALTNQAARLHEPLSGDAAVRRGDRERASSGIRPTLAAGSRLAGMAAIAPPAKTWPPGQGNSGAPVAGAAAGAGAEVCSGPGPNSSTGAPVVVVAGGDTAAACSCCVGLERAAVVAGLLRRTGRLGSTRRTGELAEIFAISFGPRPEIFGGGSTLFG